MICPHCIGQVIMGIAVMLPFGFGIKMAIVSIRARSKCKEVACDGSHAH